MDQRTQEFMAAFQTFLDEVVANHREHAQSKGDRVLEPVLRAHLGADPRIEQAVGQHDVVRRQSGTPVEGDAADARLERGRVSRRLPGRAWSRSRG
jgi:hypothetical protein